MGFEALWTVGLHLALVSSSLPCGQNGGINGPGSLNGILFAPNGAGSHRYGHTCNAPAEARCRFETEYRLRTVNEILPVNRPPADLLSGESLDDHHGAATARAKPSWGRLRLAASRRLRGLLWTALQQLLTERQKLFPAPVSQEAGKANPDEPAR